MNIYDVAKNGEVREITEIRDDIYREKQKQKKEFKLAKKLQEERKLTQRLRGLGKLQ